MSEVSAFADQEMMAAVMAAVSAFLASEEASATALRRSRWCHTPQPAAWRARGWRKVRFGGPLELG